MHLIITMLNITNAATITNNPFQAQSLLKTRLEVVQ